MTPLPKVRIPHPHVVVDSTINDGDPLIEGTRVPVQRLFAWHRQGTTVETLLRRYPQLGPARIFDALAFAYDNLDLMTACLLRERSGLAKGALLPEKVAAAMGQVPISFKRER